MIETDDGWFFFKIERDDEGLCVAVGPWALLVAGFAAGLLVAAILWGGS